MLAPLDAFDAAVEARVQAWRTPGRDRFFYSLSSAGDHSLLWVAIAATRQAVAGGRPRSAVRLMAVLAAESALTNGLVKSVFRRLRPVSDEPQGPLAPLPYGLRRPITSAFPSGHASAAFTAAAFLAKGDPLAPAYYALAGAVSASRVYVRLHHFSDVLAGAALGVVLGRLARRLAP